MAELAGNPEKCAPSIHVAGSKGKGSVTSMLAAMLTEAGYRVGRYMSPHVVDIRERLCLGDTYFDEDVYLSAGEELRRIAEERIPSLAGSQRTLFDPSTEEGCEPTFWELLTLLFFLCARYAKCDVMTVETGMGGRLDSTNVLDPLVSVITLIELEHTNILGGTITEIAGEKAGIIKQGKPLVLAKQCGEALEVFRKKAEEKNSPLIYLPETAELTNINVTSQGTGFSLMFKSPHLLCAANQRFDASPHGSFFSIPIPGKVQAENAVTAISALLTAFPLIKRDAIRHGLAKLKIPARFEKISEEPPFIIDGAHTPESLSRCIETFRSLYGEGGVLLFGCASDKDAEAMAKAAHKSFSKIIITTPGNFKASNPEQVYDSFVSVAGEEKTHLVKDTKDSVMQAVFFAKNSRRGEMLPILGTGSFYLVSEIRKIFVF